MTHPRYEAAVAAYSLAVDLDNTQPVLYSNVRGMHMHTHPTRERLGSVCIHMGVCVSSALGRIGELGRVHIHICAEVRRMPQGRGEVLTH